MLQDGNALLPWGTVQPRQVLTASSLSTSLISSSTTSTIPKTTSFVAHTAPYQVPHAIVSTVTGSLHLGEHLCTGAIPGKGIIEINSTYTLYLEEAVPYIGPCGNHSIYGSDSGNNTVIKDKEPFYTSLTPQIYVLAAATIVAYILVILIFITPRTFYVGGPSGTAGTTGLGNGLRTFFPGSSGRSSSAIGIGRRPLLQKIAALTVAVSLTIATSNSFDVAAKQYESGFMDAQTLVEEVVGSMEVRISRVISDTFLWLAQVQTLIRLFPRHKEKVTIKWLGFGLVLCDSVFSCLENFLSKSNRVNPQSFEDAIPALSYLFELSISMIYASCVLYYALSKRRFAFWHAKMRNVCLVALLSIVAVLIPVVFFITDLAIPELATWGEYIRWVGAAAASVVVWEWVERIESLERDEKKDGILGREVFDGDEMLDITPSEDGETSNGMDRGAVAGRKKRSKFWKNVRDLNIDIQPNIPLRKWRKGKGLSGASKNEVAVVDHPVKSDLKQVSRPPQAVTPISRSDTNSAASTVYAVKYHDPFSPSPAIPEDRAVDQRRASIPIDIPPAISDESTLTNSTDATNGQQKAAGIESAQATSTGRQIWQGVANPFKRKRTEPPAEVAAQIAESNSRRSPIDGHLNIRSRFNAFTTAQKARMANRSQKNRTPLAVTVIPAQPRASQANIYAPEIMNEGMAASDAGETISEHSTDSASDSETDHVSPPTSSLPVTVIPAPTRGGRTWSPDDLRDKGQETPTAQRIAATGGYDGSGSTSLMANTYGPATIESQRGALTISESPSRPRNTGNLNASRTSGMNRTRNARSGTMISIGDRLGSVSPGAVSSNRSNTADTNRRSQSAPTDDTARQSSV